jgi:MacB-like periplasmic core domain
VAGTALLSGRALTWHDDKNAPRVAVVNQVFANKMFGSATNALGQYFKMDDGARIKVVGIAEDGKYTANITEKTTIGDVSAHSAVPRDGCWLVVRSSDDEQQLVAAIRTKLRDLDSGLPAFTQTWNEEMNGALFASRMAAASLGVLCTMGASLSVTAFLEWRRTRSASRNGTWEFAWPWALSGRKC